MTNIETAQGGRRDTDIRSGKGSVRVYGCHECMSNGDVDVRSSKVDAEWTQNRLK
jgi:hypothetical protein